MTAQNDVPPITEDDIAHYLSTHPEFFERHAATLATIQLQSQYGKRAVSLAERQAEMLREKIKLLEGRIMEMVRNANENAMIADKLQKWTRTLLLTSQAVELPSRVTQEIKHQFLVPQAAIKVWAVNDSFAAQAFALNVSDEAKTFAGSLQLPYCGVNAHVEAVSWLDQPELVSSLALIPLRAGAALEAFGMLVLASPDPQRFNAGMGTEFLERMGEIASAALSRLRA
jgi:uncharacterized protein